MKFINLAEERYSLHEAIRDEDEYRRHASERT